MIVLLALLGCQEPFGADRHDLVGDRIAAVRVVGSGEARSAEVALVRDGRLWGDAHVDIGWAWVAPVDDAVAGLEASALGDAVVGEAPEGRGRLAVVASFPSGAERRAFIDVGGDPDAVAMAGVDVSEVTELGVEDVSVSDLDVDARAALGVTATTAVQEGGFARLTARMVADGASPRVRWMTSAGTFFELERSITDWAAGEVVLDGGEIVSREALGAGAVPMIALAVDDAGATDFVDFDVVVGDAGPGSFVGARWLPGERLHAGLWEVELVADDAAPAGVAIATAAATSADALDADDPYGTVAIGCGDGGPFTPRWLVVDWCTRADVVGVPLVVEVAP